MIRVVIADDHPMMRRALAQVLTATLAAPVTVIEAGSLAEADAALGAAPADLLLLDLYMPGMDGFAGLVMLRAEFPSVPVVIVSANEEPLFMRRALAFGASGYIPKSAPVATIGLALRAVLAGDIWAPEAAAEAPIDEEAAQFAAQAAELTPQQLRVLMLLADGKLNKQIAFELAISEATVKFHLSQIFRRLAVQSRTQAVIAMQRLRVSPPAGSAFGHTVPSVGG